MIEDIFKYIALNPETALLQIMSACAVGVVGVWVAFYKELKKQEKENKVL